MFKYDEKIKERKQIKEKLNYYNNLISIIINQKNLEKKKKEIEEKYEIEIKKIKKLLQIIFDFKNKEQNFKLNYEIFDLIMSVIVNNITFIKINDFHKLNYQIQQISYYEKLIDKKKIILILDNSNNFKIEKSIEQNYLKYLKEEGLFYNDNLLYLLKNKKKILNDELIAFDELKLILEIIFQEKKEFEAIFCFKNADLFSKNLLKRKLYLTKEEYLKFEITSKQSENKKKNIKLMYYKSFLEGDFDAIMVIHKRYFFNDLNFFFSATADIKKRGMSILQNSEMLLIYYKTELEDYLLLLTEKKKYLEFKLKKLENEILDSNNFLFKYKADFLIKKLNKIDHCLFSKNVMHDFLFKIMYNFKLKDFLKGKSKIYNDKTKIACRNILELLYFRFLNATEVLDKLTFDDFLEKHYFNYNHFSYFKSIGEFSIGKDYYRKKIDFDICTYFSYSLYSERIDVLKLEYLNRIEIIEKKLKLLYKEINVSFINNIKFEEAKKQLLHNVLFFKLMHERLFKQINEIEYNEQLKVISNISNKLFLEDYYLLIFFGSKENILNFYKVANSINNSFNDKVTILVKAILSFEIPNKLIMITNIIKNKIMEEDILLKMILNFVICLLYRNTFDLENFLFNNYLKKEKIYKLLIKQSYFKQSHYIFSTLNNWVKSKIPLYETRSTFLMLTDASNLNINKTFKILQVFGESVLKERLLSLETMKMNDIKVTIFLFKKIINDIKLNFKNVNLENKLKIILEKDLELKEDYFFIGNVYIYMQENRHKFQYLSKELSVDIKKKVKEYFFNSKIFKNDLNFYMQNLFITSYLIYFSNLNLKILKELVILKNKLYKKKKKSIKNYF